jgi:hypothetical protein
MSLALKRHGPFVVLWQYVLTSGRRVRGMGGLEMLAALVRMAFFPHMLRQRSCVEKIWYDSNREEDGKIPASIVIKISNTIMLLLLLAVITSPLWDLVPWSLTPRGTPLGQFRWAVGIFCCHVGLVLWPCAYFLLRSLVRQTRSLEWLKTMALVMVCIWLAWSATREVVWFWMWALAWSGIATKDAG